MTCWRGLLCRQEAGRECRGGRSVNVVQSGSVAFVEALTGLVHGFVLRIGVREWGGGLGMTGAARVTQREAGAVEGVQDRQGEAGMLPIFRTAGGVQRPGDAGHVGLNGMTDLKLV